MKAPIDWLKEFINFSQKPAELADIFTMLGAEVDGIENDVLHIEVTPNRPDWLSIYGLARELGAYLGKTIKLPWSLANVYQPKSDLLEIHFANAELIPRYSALILDNIKIRPSSPIIQSRLKSIGINVHNNLVDITNYVMIELGMPLHGFDYDQIHGQTMWLRESRTGEKITTLDEKTYSLPPGSLVIEDQERLIDLMGIKGGANSGISPSTKRVLLQATADDPKRIRATSKAIGLTTEASYRYERGVDQSMTVIALERASQLIKQSCGAKVVAAMDIINQPFPHRTVTLDPHRVLKLIRTSLTEHQIFNYLIRLGFKIDDHRVEVPAWRVYDIFFEEDLIEDVARLHGYDKLKKRLIRKIEVPRSKNYQSILSLKAFLVSRGFQEVLTYSLVSKAEASRQALQLANPLSPETSFYRDSLIPGLVKTIAKNPWVDRLKIFEIGRVFKQGCEQEYLGLASTQKLPIKLRSQLISRQHPLARFNKLRRAVLVTEMALKDAVKHFQSEIKKSTPAVALPLIQRLTYRPISQYPPVIRDVSMIVEQSVKAADIASAIKSVDDRVLMVDLFDDFHSPKFQSNKKSLAFHIVFDDLHKTLADPVIKKIWSRIIKLLERDFSAQIR